MWIPPCPPSTPLSLHIWARLWRSEVNFMCLPRPLSTLLYEPGSLSVLELTDLVWLADQWSLGTQHLCLCSSGVTRVCHHAQGLNSGLHAFAALTMLTAWSTSPASLVLEIKLLNLSVWGMVMGVRDTLALTQRRLKQPHSCLTWAGVFSVPWDLVSLSSKETIFITSLIICHEESMPLKKLPYTICVSYKYPLNVSWAVNLKCDSSPGHLLYIIESIVMMDVMASIRNLVQRASWRLLFSMLGWIDWCVCFSFLFSFFLCFLHSGITHLQQSAWLLNVHCLMEFRYEYIQHTPTQINMEHNSNMPGSSPWGKQ